MRALTLLLLSCVACTPSRSPRAPIVEAGGVPQAVMNGLRLNGSPINRLVLAPLSTEGLRGNADIQALLDANPGAQTLMRYLVECALPEGSALAIPTRTATVMVSGALGLAPEWESAACDEACQEWVSACLYARTNAFGLPVRIYLTGEHPAFGADVPAPDFWVQEGAFYGNFFLDMPREYACRGSGFDPLYSSIRVCTQRGEGCGFTRVGACREIDGDTGLPADRHACDRESPTRVLGDCWNRATLPGEDRHPEPSRRYTRVITIFLRQSIFSPGLATAGHARPEGPIACGDPAPRPSPQDPVPDPATPATAGTRCFTDDACDSELLVCDNRGPQSSCTTACTSDRNQLVEQAACGGPGSTCLELGPDTGLCVGACDPVGTGGAMRRRCRSGAVCTRYWLNQSDSAAGCFNFCHGDADCEGAPCHLRTGACGAAVDGTLLPDGSPCDSSSPEAQCRGVCLSVTATPSQGLCGSFVDRALRSRCFDHGSATMQPVGPGGPGLEDDLNVCIYKLCARDSDCGPPLLCKSGILAGQRACAY